MAVRLNNIPNNITEYPNSFKRQGAFPLDRYSVFSSYQEAKTYAETSKIAYVTQPIGVAYKNGEEVVADYYIIGDENGTLIHIGNSKHNLDEINTRIEEIERFFTLGDGESLKETLDELIELQKWIEEHLGEFDKFQEETSQRLETLQTDLTEEISRATKKEQQLAQDLNNTATQLNETIENRYSLEATERIEAINSLETNITAKLNAEITNRGESDDLLYNKIEEEVATREEETGSLRTALTEEINAARTAESELDRRLTSEEKTRMNEDLAIMVTLNNEKQERQQKDTKLAELIEEEIKRANEADKSTREFITEKLDALDYSYTASSRNYINSITQTNGLVEVTTERLPKHYEEVCDTDENTTFAKYSNYIDGDTFVIKTPITDDRYSYTAYIREGDVWKAMDGNYDANNVYFNSDITLAGSYTTVGNVTKSSNTATGTLSAKGKSLAQVMQSIFTKELYPKSGSNRDFPNISISTTGNTSGEVGSSYTLPTATVKIDDVGSYTYPPTATGIQFNVGEVTLAQGAINTASNKETNKSVMTKGSTFTLQAVDAETLYTDTEKSYTFNAAGNYTAGVAPKTNLETILDDNDTPESWTYRIPAGKATAIAVIAKRTGYRYMFAGGTTAETVTSAVVRGFNNAKTNSKPTTETTALEFTAAGGTTKAICVYPASWTGTPYFEMFGLAWAENNNFVAKSNMQVADARGTNEDGSLNGAMEYKVYAWELDTPLAAETTKFRVYFK